MGSRRGHVADLELERLEAAERAAGEAGDHVHAIALGQPLGEVGATERDPVEHVDLAAEDQLGVTAVGGPNALHGEAQDGDEGLRVAGAARREAGEVAEQAVVHEPRRQREVDIERASPVLRRRRRGLREEAVREGVPAVGRKLEARRRGVTAVSQQQVVACVEGAGEIEPPVAAARGANHVAIGRRQDCAHDRGPAGLVRQATRDEADDADRPGPDGEDRRAVRPAGRPDARVGRRDLLEPALLPRSVPGVRHAEGGARLGDGRAHEVAAGAVGLFEHRGQRGRLVDRGGEQEARGVQRLPHPPGRVQPRREDESDGLEVDAARADAGTRQERGDAGPRRGSHAFQSELRDRAVLAQHGRHVRDGPDRGQVRQLEGLGLRAGQLAQEQARHRERDARAREPAIGIGGDVVALRVDDGDRCGQDVGQVVMVGDDDVDPAGHGRGHLRDARGAGVDGHDQDDAVTGGGLDRRHRQAVALLEAAGDVRHGVQTQPPERQDQLGETREAIGIEVAEHHHPLGALDGPPNPRHQPVGVGQQPGVVEAVGGRTEEPRHRGRIGDAAAREDRRRERPEAELTGRRADLAIEVERLREHPAVTRVDHRREDAMPALCRACPDGRTVAGAGLAGSPWGRIGSRPRPGPSITWRVGGLGEPHALRRAAGRPAGATRRAAGRR
jgi:hypothetical protein